MGSEMCIRDRTGVLCSLFLCFVLTVRLAAKIWHQFAPCSRRLHLDGFSKRYGGRLKGGGKGGSIKKRMPLTPEQVFPELAIPDNHDDEEDNTRINGELVEPGNVFSFIYSSGAGNTRGVPWNSITKNGGSRRIMKQTICSIAESTMRRDESSKGNIGL